MKAEELIGGDMKIGDKYRVLKGKSSPCLPWTDGMDYDVGKVGIVVETMDLDRFVKLHFSDGKISYWLLPEWLEKVEGRKPEFNELIQVKTPSGEWHNGHVAMILPDGKALCFTCGEKYPDWHHAYVWKEWRFIDQPSDDEWNKYTF